MTQDQVTVEDAQVKDVADVFKLLKKCDSMARKKKRNSKEFHILQEKANCLRREIQDGFLPSVGILIDSISRECLTDALRNTLYFYILGHAELKVKLNILRSFQINPLKYVYDELSKKQKEVMDELEDFIPFIKHFMKVEQDTQKGIILATYKRDTLWCENGNMDDGWSFQNCCEALDIDFTSARKRILNFKNLPLINLIQSFNQLVKVDGYTPEKGDNFERSHYQVNIDRDQRKSCGNHATFWAP